MELRKGGFPSSALELLKVNMVAASGWQEAEASCEFSKFVGSRRDLCLSSELFGGAHRTVTEN